MPIKEKDPKSQRLHSLWAGTPSDCGRQILQEATEAEATTSAKRENFRRQHDLFIHQTRPPSAAFPAWNGPAGHNVQKDRKGLQKVVKETARQTIRANWRILIRQITSPAKTKVNGETSWICPLCGHGTHGDGLTFDPTSQDGNSLKCFGCGWHGDIIDLYRKQTGKDYGETLAQLAEAVVVSIDGQPPVRAQNGPMRRGAKEYAEESKRPHKASFGTLAAMLLPDGDELVEKEMDYTAFFEEAARHLTETGYHRGISLATLVRYKVGFVPDWRHPKAPASMPASPRLIIPTSPCSYLARDTRQPLPEEAKRYAKSKVGRVHLFNADALYTADQPVFVVEGELDALSILDVGGAAVALGSVSNWRRLADMAGEKAPVAPLVLALDTDGPGQAAESSLAEVLAQAGIPCYRQQVAGAYKDANEALQADRAGLAAAVREVVERIAEEADAERTAQREALEKEAAAYSLQSFIDQIGRNTEHSALSTGLVSVDELLDGGLYPGLYIVGAISSLGKTTFCLQIADQIAAEGQDVLIFSLEMDRDELIAKSISRLTLLLDLQQNGTTANAKTTRGILTGSRYKNYSEKEKRLIAAAVDKYQNGAARHIYITEGVGDVGVKEIREKAQRHYRITGRRPVVMVDYLQIIAPADIRATDKQNTDKAVLELKRLSRDLKTPVLAISAFNRQNYRQGVNLASFRESSSIEYSADVLIGLQHEGMDVANDDTSATQAIADRAAEAAAAGRFQKIQAKILKNRNGRKGTAALDYCPMFNYFRDGEQQEQQQERPRREAKRR